ncbi:hypothetical protein T484DRAFT_1636922, partial [Baffinella frigidus]
TLNPQPSTRNPQPSTLNPQPSTLIPQHSTLNTQHSTLNSHPSTLNPQPSTLNPRPSTLNTQHSTLNPHPSTLNPQPSTLNPAPLTGVGRRDREQAGVFARRERGRDLPNAHRELEPFASLAPGESEPCVSFLKERLQFSGRKALIFWRKGSNSTPEIPPRHLQASGDATVSTLACLPVESEAEIYQTPIGNWSRLPHF